MSYIGLGATAVDGVVASAKAAVVSAMQNQLNRFAKKNGWALLPLTGGVGAKSIDIFKKVQASASPAWTGYAQLRGYSATKDVMEGNAGTITSLLVSYADTLGLPYVAAPKGSSTTTTTTTTTSGGGAVPGGAPPPGATPETPSWFSKLSTTEIAAAGVGALALLVAAGIIPLGKKASSTKPTEPE